MFKEPVVGGKGDDRAEDDKIGEGQPGATGNGMKRESPPFTGDGSCEQEKDGAGKQGKRREQQRMTGQIGSARIDDPGGPGKCANQNGDRGKQHSGTGGQRSFAHEQRYAPETQGHAAEERGVDTPSPGHECGKNKNHDWFDSDQQRG